MITKLEDYKTGGLKKTFPPQQNTPRTVHSTKLRLAMLQPEFDRSSLENPPIYRRMLAAADPLQVSQTTLLVAMTTSFLAAVISEVWFIYHCEKPFDLLGVAVRGVFILANSLLIGRFLARWLGSRAATAGAFAFATTLSVMLGLAGNLQALCMTGTMYYFARQAVAGRAPLDESVSSLRICWWGLAFLIIGFSYKLGVILLVTFIIFCLVSQNSSLLKRFFQPVGLIIIGSSIVARILLEISIVSADNSYLRLIGLTPQLTLPDFAVLLLPWWPLLILTMYLSVRYGHYATLWFQLIAIWLLVTTTAIAFGVLDRSMSFAAITPPASGCHRSGSGKGLPPSRPLPLVLECRVRQRIL